MVTVYLLSEPVQVAQVVVDPQGDFDAELRVPAGMALGEHTLQFNGVSAQMLDRSVSMGVLVRATPSGPRDLEAAPGNAQATLTWRKPASDGDEPLEGYRIEQSSDGGETWHEVLTLDDPEARTAVVEGLHNDSLFYRFRVQASNLIGWGTWSRESDDVMPGRPRARLAYVQSVSDSLPALGDTVVLRYEVSNTGTGASDDEVVLGSGIIVPRLEILEIVHVSEGTTLDLASGTWTILELAPGASVQLELRMIVREGEAPPTASTDPAGTDPGGGAGSGSTGSGSGGTP